MPAKNGNSFPFMLCCDSSMRVGLHVTLYSLLKNLGEGVFPEVHILTDDFGEPENELLRQTAEKAGRPHELSIYPFRVPEVLSNLPSLRDSYFTYARLFAHEKLDAPRMVYLDSDLYINKDLSPLTSMDMEGNMLAARTNGTASGFIDKQFLCEMMGLDPTTPTFNAGVLVVDMDMWRASGTGLRVSELLTGYGPHLAAHDQSVLNAIAGGKFFHLDASYNVHAKMPRSLAPANLDNQVWHFMGAPKPWDFMAPVVNGFAASYFKVLDQTALAGWRPTFKVAEMRRSLKNRNYFARHLLAQVKRR